MTWVNAFTKAPCRVEVYPDGFINGFGTGGPLFSEIMSADSSQTFVNTSWSPYNTHLTINVDVDGLVTLSSPDKSSYNNGGDGFVVVVIPQLGWSSARLNFVAASHDPAVISTAVNFGYVRDNSIIGNGYPQEIYSLDPIYTKAGLYMLYSGSSATSLPFTVGSFALELIYPPSSVTASDEAILVGEGSSGNIVPTQIVADGVTTTPDSLSIDSLPSNGSAVVNGLTITYTPDAGYSGQDSFTYTGTVSGVASNAGTVDVTVRALPPDYNQAFVDFRYSKDGGHNWSDWRQCSLGETGSFMKRVEMRRFGQGVQWVFDIRVTDPGKADLMAASTMAEAEQ